MAFNGCSFELVYLLMNLHYENKSKQNLSTALAAAPIAVPAIFEPAPLNLCNDKLFLVDGRNIMRWMFLSSSIPVTAGIVAEVFSSPLKVQCLFILAKYNNLTYFETSIIVWKQYGE
jgi:hypothetical protein